MDFQRRDGRMRTGPDAPVRHHGLERVALVCALTGLIAGCAGSVRVNDIPDIGGLEADRLLFERGTEAVDDGNWSRARVYFLDIRDNYPQSEYRAEARLQIADTYEGEGTPDAYVRALAEYQDFLSLYPTHPRTGYAQYKLGMVHFHQMRRAERDQTETLSAIAEFEAFIARFPADHELMSQVREQLRGARDRLGMHDYQVGVYYYGRKNYAGAMARFRELIEQDPGFSRLDGVYFYLATTLADTAQVSEAIPYFARLLDEFTESEFAEQAAARLTELEAGSLP
ncbi:MAG: outer membrane protein assembly factor BamD [bacterium]